MSASTAALGGCPEPLARSFDVALLDLDGVVYRGGDAVPHASAALADAVKAGMCLAFVTNNALRPPEQVTEKLRSFDVPASVEDVVTSAQAAARILAERLEPGAKVLLSGGRGLREAVQAAGLEPVDVEDGTPVAVVSGYDPELDYDRLCEAALAIRRGVLWVASNLDATVPAERGLLPGAGSFVALLRTATDRSPVVAGKPERALHEESVRRTGAQHPLVVGDRLDTDIEGAVRAGTPSLLVLTGVAVPREIVRADPTQRPTFLGHDLRALLAPAPDVSVDEGETVRARCGSVDCELADGTLRWTGAADAEGTSDGLDALRAACAVAWAAADRGLEVRGTDGELPPGCEDLF